MDDADDVDEDDHEDEDEVNHDLIDDNWSQDVITSDQSANDDDEVRHVGQEKTDVSKCMLGTLIQKCRVLIRAINHSQILTAFTSRERENQKISRRLTLDCITRWNSTFYSLESLVQNKPVLEKLFANKRQLSISAKQQETLGLCELSSDEWACLSHLLHVLRPFREATELLSGARYPTIGLCFFAIRSIKDFLEIKADDESSVFANLKIFLLDSFNHYFKEDDEQARLMKVSFQQCRGYRHSSFRDRMTKCV